MRGKKTARKPPRRILIVDSHPLVRRGLAALVDNETDLTVCAAVATRQAGLAALGPSRPDLVIAELSLAEGDGLVLIKDIRERYATLPILVLSMHDAGEGARRAFRAGANGYASKQEMGDELLAAIRSVLDGGRYESPRLRGEPDTSQ